MYGVHWEMPGVGAETHRMATPPEKPIDEETFRLHLKECDLSVRGTLSGGRAVEGKGIVSPQILTPAMRAPAIIWRRPK